MALDPFTLLVLTTAMAAESWPSGLADACWPAVSANVNVNVSVVPVTTPPSLKPFKELDQ